MNKEGWLTVAGVFCLFFGSWWALVECGEVMPMLLMILLMLAALFAAEKTDVYEGG